MKSTFFFSVLATMLLIKLAQSADECTTSDDCKNKYPDTECINKLCKCVSGYVESEKQKNYCLQEAHYNKTCQESIQCVDKNTFCDNKGKCQNKPGMNADECTTSDDCKNKYPDTECINKLCKCVSGYVESEKQKNYCLQEAHYNKTCQESIQCVDKNTFCDNKGKCQNKPGMNAAYMSISSLWLIALISSFLLLKK